MGLSLKYFRKRNLQGLLFLLIGLLVASCSPFGKIIKTPDQPSKREIRKANRAAKYVDRAIKISPEIIKGKEVTLPVTLETPEHTGVLRINTAPDHISRHVTDSLIAIAVASPQNTPRIIREIIEKPCEMSSIPFEDSLLVGDFRIERGVAIFNYTVKSFDVTGEVTTTTQTINPKNYKPMPQKWWQLTLQGFGMLFIICLAIWLALQTIKKP